MQWRSKVARRRQIVPILTSKRPQVSANLPQNPANSRKSEQVVELNDQGVSASSVHAEFGSSVHAGPDRLCTRAFFAPDRLYTQCLLLCTRRDRGVDSCMFPCLLCPTPPHPNPPHPRPPLPKTPPRLLRASGCALGSRHARSAGRVHVSGCAF